MTQYVLALDQGTTSSRAILFNRRGEVVAQAQREFAQHFPGPAWVEHDPMDILTTQLNSAVEALALGGASSRDIAAVGITNQRETTLVWDRKSGAPVY
jgi:glycerol kinase